MSSVRRRGARWQGIANMGGGRRRTRTWPTRAQAYAWARHTEGIAHSSGPVHDAVSAIRAELEADRRLEAELGQTPGAWVEVPRAELEVLIRHIEGA